MGQYNLEILSELQKLSLNVCVYLCVHVYVVEGGIERRDNNFPLSICLVHFSEKSNKQQQRK